MRKKLFLLGLLFFFLFLTKTVKAQYACNADCSGNPSGCVAGTSCINIAGVGWRCRDPDCTVITNCTCPNYTIKGNKVKMPGNQSVAPFTGQTVTIDGGSPTTADPYSFTASPIDHTVAVSLPAGSSVGYTLCYNSEGCHTITSTPGSSVSVDSNQAINNVTNYADVWWHFTPLTPNCKNISAPASVFVGDNVTVSADYEDGGGPLTSASMYIHGGGLDQNCDGTALTLSSSSPPTRTYTWTADTTGTYTVYCRADNSATAQCRGDCYTGGPPIYACAGTDGNGLTSSTTITVTNPGPWYKLKDASLYKIGGITNSVVTTINKFTDEVSETDDTTTRNTIIGDNGIGSTDGSYNPGPSYNPIALGTNNWHNAGYTFTQSLISGFTDYVRARKENVTITALGNIETNKVNLITGDQTITDAVLTKAPFVLIISGNVAINADFNNGASPKSLSIISSGKITFDASVTYANGLFIANDVEIGGSGAGATDTNGLKIKGNLVSSHAFTNNRNRQDNSRPSLFIVLEPDQFIDLLPLISTSKYDFQQTQ